MRHNRPRNEPIIRIADIPPIGDIPQQTLLATRAIRGRPHAEIMPVALGRTLPRQALDVGLVVPLRVQRLALPVVATVGVHHVQVDVGVVRVAGWDGVAEEAEVPLYSLSIGVQNRADGDGRGKEVEPTYASIALNFPLVNRWQSTGTGDEDADEREAESKGSHGET